MFHLQFFKRSLSLFVIVSMLFTSLGVSVYADATTPTNLFVSGVTGSGATLSFSGDTSATDYEIYRTQSGGAESLIDTIQETSTTKVDIVFIIDRSGSMGSHINNVKNNINSFASNLAAGGGDYRLGLVTYSDTTYGEPLIKTNFTSDATAFQNTMSNVSLASGGDWRESGLEGIADPTNGALSLAFRNDAAKHFVLVTDAEVHDNNDGDGGDGKSIYDIDTVAQTLKNQNIKLTVISTTTASTQTQLSRLSNPTNGAYYYITSGFSTSLNSLASNIVTTKQYVMTGLSEYTEYSMRVKACDSGTCSPFSSSVTFRTLDVTAPTVPSNLAVSNKTTTSFTLSWDGSTDSGSGVKEYVVYRSGTAVATIAATTATSYSTTLTGLSSTQVYSMTVAARDNAGNLSTLSPALSVNMNDSIAPTAPMSLVANYITQTSLQLTWIASTDNVAVTAYDVYQGDDVIATLPAILNGINITSFDVIGLTPATAYTFSVKAKDAAANVSDASNIVSVSTLSDNEAPTELVLNGTTVPENVWVDYEIGVLETTDANEDDTFTYSLVVGEGSDDNSNFWIDDNVLKAAIVFDFAEQESQFIRVRSTDSGGLWVENSFEITVAQSNVTLNATNKIATIHFDDTIFDNSSAIEVGEGESKKTLKQLITITNEANEQDPEYVPLGANDTVVIKKNTIVITFENQITGYYNRIKIADEALKDRFNYISGEQITTPLVVDVTGPKLIKSSMDKKKKKITLRFSEKIFMATAGAKPADVAVSFKNAITFKRGSGSFGALAAKDKVSVSGREVIITLATPLSTNDNQVKFADESLRDLLSNKSDEITSAEIEDMDGPVLSKVSLGADNKTVTIAFDEESFNATTGSKAEKEAGLRSAVTFAADGATFVALGQTDSIQLIKGVITVKFASALSGSTNRIRIAGNALQDLFTNKNNTLTTSQIVADSVGPVCKTADDDDADLCASAALPSRNLNARLIITLNERVSVVDRKLVKNSITLSTNGTYAALGASDKVSTSRNQIVVTFAKPLVAAKDGVTQEYQVKVAAGAVKDFFGNQNLEIETVTFQVDTSGPKLR